MTPGDREAAIERLRAYRQQMHDADTAMDRTSLDRAADLVALFEDKEWVKQVSTLRSKTRLGRPVDPESFTQFAKWAEATVGLSPRRQCQLRAAHELVRTYLNGVRIKPEGEYAIRPLLVLAKAGRAERGIPDVWDQAVLAAGGVAPDASTVKAALSGWTTANVPKAPRSQKVAERTIQGEKRRITTSFQQLLRTGDVAAAKATIEDLLDLTEKYLAETGQQLPS